MAENTQNQEPSMEEILASIRRIISEDGATVEPTPADPNAEPAAEPAAVPAAEPAPVIDMAAMDAEPPILDLVEEVTEDGSVQNIAPEPEPVVYAAPPPEPIAHDTNRLLSDTAAQASANALNNLSRLVGGSININSQPIGGGHKTLESMVAELLRPILKDWLDRNLPAIVERIVQKEIQKITRDLG
ncbi:MAG: DUF2497 domain-containing protein [Alphaproteobacteria bacterium]|nr:DUF2497 domain-containing protein [Alphaproteobacteria bacterium]